MVSRDCSMQSDGWSVYPMPQMEAWSLGRVLSIDRIHFVIRVYAAFTGASRSVFHDIYQMNAPMRAIVEDEISGSREEKSEPIRSQTPAHH